MLSFREHGRVGKSQEEGECWQVDLDALNEGSHRKFQVAMAVMCARNGRVGSEICACLGLSATELHESGEGGVVGLLLASAKAEHSLLGVHVGLLVTLTCRCSEQAFTVANES